MHVRVSVCTIVCMHVYMYVCMSLCMYSYLVWMCVWFVCMDVNTGPRWVKWLVVGPSVNELALVYIGEYQRAHVRVRMNGCVLYLRMCVF